MRHRPNVRKLMAWTLLAACGLGWSIPVWVQRDAVAAVARAGGRVAYGWDLLDSGLPDPGRRGWWPAWLADRVGPDCFSTVRRVTVDFRDSCPRLDTAALARLGGLKWLDIHAPLSEDDLARLGTLTRLRRLDLAASGVGDAGLAHLSGLRELRALNLAGTRVTDAGLDVLARARSLRSVDLEGTDVTEAGVERLRSIRPDLSIHHGAARRGRAPAEGPATPAPQS